MYNKLFTKILDSSIWLENTPTRLVWITMLAAMDEDGMCQFASVGNLAHRARITKEEAEEAVLRLESPDPDSSDPDNEGRRIERVPGGWIVLNASKYRDLVTREVAKEKTRVRVARHREKKVCNGSVTPVKRPVTPSEAYTDTNTEADTNTEPPKSPKGEKDEEFEQFWKAYPRHENKKKALEVWKRTNPPLGALLKAIETQKKGKSWRDGFIPHPERWLRDRRWEDEIQPDLSGLPESVRATREGRLYPGPQHVKTTRVPDDV